MSEISYLNVYVEVSKTFVMSDIRFKLFVET